MIAYGPIQSEAANMEGHRTHRNNCAAMEKALRDALNEAGYIVLNEVHCRQRLDGSEWNKVLKAFAVHFPKLKAATAAGETANDELSTVG